MLGFSTAGGAFPNGVCEPRQAEVSVVTLSVFAGSPLLQTTIHSLALGIQLGAGFSDSDPDWGVLCSFVPGCNPPTGFGSSSLAAFELAKVQKSACLELVQQGPARSVPTIARSTRAPFLP